MTTRFYHIPFKDGFHARPIVFLVRKMSTLDLTTAYLEKQDGEQVSLMSLLNLLSSALSYNVPISVTVDGPDEERALEYLEWFFHLETEDILYGTGRDREDKGAAEGFGDEGPQL